MHSAYENVFNPKEHNKDCWGEEFIIWRYSLDREYPLASQTASLLQRPNRPVSEEELQIDWRAGSRQKKDDVDGWPLGYECGVTCKTFYNLICKCKESN